MWLLASEEPTNIEAPILIWTKNNELIAFKNTMSYKNGDLSKPISVWKWMVGKYHIKYWVYQVDVMNI